MFGLVLWSSQRDCTKHFLLHASAIFSFSSQYKYTDFSLLWKRPEASPGLVSLCPHLLLIPWPHLTLQLEQANYYSPDTCVATCPHVSAGAGPSQRERVSSHLSVKFV